MANHEGVRAPDPVRAKCIRSVFVPSALREVAHAVAEATELETRIYVERWGALWRWSLVHSGGGYPLLRISARYLKMDYQAIFVGFRTLPNQFAILCQDPGTPEEPDDWTILEFDGPATVEVVTKRIIDAFQPTGA